MKFFRIALFCQRNMRCVQVRSPTISIYTQNFDSIYNLNSIHQSIFNRQSTMNYSKNVYDSTSIPIVYYDEIKDLPKHPEKLLIDVREPQEIVETGKIPTSINIPLADVVKALSEISDEKFVTLYGKEKPTKNKYIIFHCMSGKRSQMASESAIALGFENVNNYKGSWLDWAEHEGLPKK